MLDRISVAELLIRNPKGVIVTVGKCGIAAVKVGGLRDNNGNVHIVTERSARFDTTTKQWRPARQAHGAIAINPKIRGFLMPGSVSLHTTRGTVALIRTDKAPIVSLAFTDEIPLPDFDALV